MAPIRIQKFLSMAGVCSRRKAEELISQGKVRVNGTVCTRLGTKIDPEKDRIELGGHSITLPASQAEHIYLAFHKPKGILTTLMDPQGRPTIKPLLEEFTKRRIFPVGRLDKDSEGLLICTSDGELANRLIHPRYKVEKVYLTTVTGHPDRKKIERLREGGIEIQGKPIKPCKIRVIRKGRDQTTYEVILKEGRKRQIREMFRSVGHRVIRLRRTSIGPVQIGNLKPGQARDLSEHEINELRKAAGLTNEKLHSNTHGINRTDNNRRERKLKRGNRPDNRTGQG